MPVISASVYAKSSGRRSKWPSGKHVGELYGLAVDRHTRHVVCLARNPVEHVLCDGCVRVNRHTLILPGERIVSRVR